MLVEDAKPGQVLRSESLQVTVLRLHDGAVTIAAPRVWETSMFRLHHLKDYKANDYEILDSLS